MDAVGLLDINWAHGYKGGELQFIVEDTVVIQCGSHIKFHDVETGKEQIFSSAAGGVSQLAVKVDGNIFAYAETGMSPNILVYSYPEFEKCATLKGGAKLAYRSLAFSYSDHLAGLSGLPEFELTVWDWKAETKLCSSALRKEHVSNSITFNPINWREMCGFSGSYISVWTVEQAEQKYSLLCKTFSMPERSAAQGRVRPVNVGTPTKRSKTFLTVPKYAIAGLVGPLAESFEEDFFGESRMQVVTCCWTPNGNLYCGCAEGQIVLVHIEEQFIKVLLSIADKLASPIQCLCLSKGSLYLAGSDGVVQVLSVTNTQDGLLHSVARVNSPVTSLAFSPSYQTLAVGCQSGTIQLLNAINWETRSRLFTEQSLGAVACDFLQPDSEHCVSVSEDGLLQVWNMRLLSEEGRLSLGVACTSLACSTLLPVVAVGTANGQVCFIHVSNTGKQRVIAAHVLFNCPCALLKFSKNGDIFLCTAQEENLVYVVSGKPSRQFEILGYIDSGGFIEAIASPLSHTDVVTFLLLVNTRDEVVEGGDQLIRFELPVGEFEKFPSKFHASSLWELSNLKIKKSAFQLGEQCHSLECSTDGSVYTLSQKSKNIIKYKVPKSSSEKLLIMSESCAHDLPGGLLALSLHEKWLVSGGPDGKLMARTTYAMDRVVYSEPHDYALGGVKSLALSKDAQRIVTTGCDGTLVCSGWAFSDAGESKAEPAVLAARSHSEKLRPIYDAEVECLDSMPDIRLQDITADTWLNVKKVKTIEEEELQVAGKKQELRAQITSIRKELQLMLTDNEKLPAIEQLQRQEFDLDLEEQSRLRDEEENEIQMMREESEMENLACMYLRDIIKKQCWDDMEVKGRSIKAFNSLLEVSNYPMRSRTAAELAELSHVVKMRKVEIAEEQARQEIVEVDVKTQQATLLDEEDPYDLEDIEKSERSEGPALVGSFGAQFGGGSDVFYAQFQLNTRERKQNQIILLQDAVYRIKQNLNEKFNAIFKQKESEVTKIIDKNKRIRKILEDIDMEECLLKPEWHMSEKPEMLLTVSDSEVNVEKYIPEQLRKKLAAEDEARQEKGRQKVLSNRERALIDMMGGVLEIKMEDELKKDIPMPTFMSKPEEEWTDEEQKAAKEYEVKVRERMEEREKYKKQLETELRKLQTSIQDELAHFDGGLMELFKMKLDTEMVIYQEELKILRLSHSVFQMEQVMTWETELNRVLEKQKQEKQIKQAKVLEAKQEVDAFREMYDILVAEDKVLDKAFKRDFADVPIYQQEQIYRLYRRRPKGLRNPVLKGTDVYSIDPTLPGPYGKRPSTAELQENYKDALNSAVAELDNVANVPEGIEIPVWERLCEARHVKIESEQHVKKNALLLAELTSILQQRQEEDEKLQQEIEDTIREINLVSEHKMKFSYNLEVQLLLKQGQVEVNPGPFIPLYKDSVLVHKSVVEELNKVIRTFGASKIASMVESKDFRKGIIQLDWEHRKMRMLIEDYHDKIRNIQLLRVSREIQQYLNDEDSSSRQAKELQNLEQMLKIQSQHRDHVVNDKKRAIADLQKVVKKKERGNLDFDKKLQELNLCVNERQNVSDAQLGTDSDDLVRKKRYKDIVKRNRLVTLAKAQSHQIAFLHRDVERLRMRTFPALKPSSQ